MGNMKLKMCRLFATEFYAQESQVFSYLPHDLTYQIEKQNTF